MNIAKLESILDDLHDIGSEELIDPWILKTIKTVKSKLRELLDEAHEPAENAATELLPFDYETAKNEPERVVFVSARTFELMRFILLEETKQILAVTKHKTSGQPYLLFLGKDGKSSSSIIDAQLKLKPKAKTLTKVWVNRYGKPWPEVAFIEHAYVEEEKAKLRANRDAANLRCDIYFVAQEREIEV